MFLRLFLLIVAFFTIASFGVLVGGASEHHGCPFDPGTPCLMTTSAHVGAWQLTFAVTGAVAVVFVFFFVRDVWRVEEGTRSVFSHGIVRAWSFDLPPPLFQELFRHGLLHPKAP